MGVVGEGSEAAVAAAVAVVDRVPVAAVKSAAAVAVECVAVVDPGTVDGVAAVGRADGVRGVPVVAAVVADEVRAVLVG